MRFILAIPLVGFLAASAARAASPSWTVDREDRILVRVDPINLGKRTSDELIADVHVDFEKYLKGQINPASLVVIGYDPATGAPVPYHNNADAKGPGELPLRFYDDAIPWQWPDYSGYVNMKTGHAPPIDMFEGGGRYFNAMGDCKAGRVAWPHVQHQRNPAYYSVYFNRLASGERPQLAPAGFIGDGSNRCLPKSGDFAPVFQGRVAVGDLSGDGLFDLVVGNATGTVLWYQNQGTAGHPKFTYPRILFTDDGRPLDVGWSSAPCVVDWDHDGLLDLLVGGEKATVLFYKNVGDKHHPLFHLMGPLQADGKPLIIPRSPCEVDPENKIYPIDYYPVPQAVDWNGDGKIDLLLGGYITGRVWYYENIAASPSDTPKLTFRGALQADGKDLCVGWCASPCVGDFQGNGKLDLISGSMQMNAKGGDASDPNKFLLYYENIGTRQDPKLTLKPFPARGKFTLGALGTPRAIDFNGDGLLDLIVSCNGQLLMLPNIGTRDHPLFDATTPPVQGDWGNAPLGFRDLVDFNGDGWPDLLEDDKVLLNDGSGAPGFFHKSVTLAGAEKISHPPKHGDDWEDRVMADMDGDGLADIIVGDSEGNVWFHRNIGTKQSPRFDSAGKMLMLTSGRPIQVGIPPPGAAPFDILQGARTCVAVLDVRRNGRKDLALSDTYGHITLFLQSTEHPLQFEPGIKLPEFRPVRCMVRPIDWDGDGYEDLLLSYASGQLDILLNRPAKDGGREFVKGPELKIPGCWGWPMAYVADWNHNGDDDLIIQQYGYTRFIERSFIEHGYIPAHVLHFEKRPAAGSTTRDLK